jgi:L,D-transpeptidase catalytic domain
MIKKSGLKRIWFFFSSILLFLLHLPFVFAKNKPVSEGSVLPLHSDSKLLTNYLSKLTVTDHSNSFSALYDSLRLNLMGLSKQAYDYAIQGFTYLVQTGKLANDRIISIADFSLPSSKKRLFIIDLEQQKVVFNTYVAHGANSGTLNATRFSNTPESNQSSLGFYETSNTYIGGHGYSLRLDGLEPGINDNANRRDIVMHAAAYVDESLIRSQGYIGRSWGCPAVPENLHKPIIDKIKNGTCLFIFSPDKNYLAHSRVLHPAG